MNSDNNSYSILKLITEFLVLNVETKYEATVITVIVSSSVLHSITAKFLDFIYINNFIFVALYMRKAIAILIFEL